MMLINCGQIEMISMKIITIIICLVSSAFTAGYSQNIVTNGSFELMNDSNKIVPENQSDLVGWEDSYAFSVFHAYNKQGYKPEDDTIIGGVYCKGVEGNSVPDNFAGYQYPKSGNAYGGLRYASSKTTDDNRMIVRATNRLSVPLIKGQMYYIEFYLSLGDKCRRGVNNIDVIFVDKPMKNLQYLNNPTIKNRIWNRSDEFITNREDWVNVSGEYKAKGNEQFMAIGNTRPYMEREWSKKLKKSKYGSWQNTYSVYYYIDDISCYPVYNHNIQVYALDTVSVDTSFKLVRTFYANYTPEFIYPDTGKYKSHNNAQVILDSLIKDLHYKPELKVEIDYIDPDPLVFKNPTKKLVEYLISEGIREERIKVKKR